MSELVPLCLGARMARLTATRDYIDSGGGEFWFYTGSPPSGPASGTSETLLAVVALDTVSGAITFTGDLAIYTISVPRVGSASVTGIVGWVRVVDGAGDGVMDLLAGMADPVTGIVPAGVVAVLSATQIYAGGEVQLVSCVITE